MDLINGLIGQLLKDNVADTIAQKVGAAKNNTNNATEKFVPIMGQAIGKNAKTQSGLTSLIGALAKDHDGSILNDIIGALQNDRNFSIGQSILGHVLGGKQDAISNLLGSITGLSPEQSSELMKMLAPIIMGFIGKQKKESDLDITTITDSLSTPANTENSEVMGVISKLLDQDGDGDISDDLVKMGGSFLSGFLNK